MRLDRRTFLCGAAATLPLVGARKADAYVPPLPLKKAVKDAQIIAVARVTTVEEVGGVRLARAVVERPLKGTRAGAAVLFVARRLFLLCDVSAAVEGETAVLLLAPVKQQRDAGGLTGYPSGFAKACRARFGDVPVNEIVHWGHGRLPVRTERDGASYVEEQGLIMPPELVTGPKDPARVKPYRVPLDALERYLARHVKASV